MTTIQPPTPKQRRELWLLFALAFAVCLPSLLWHNWPPRDASFYYLRMIREFTEGNWAGVWYPMIPPLYVAVTGVLSTLLFLPVMLAGKLVSILFFAGSVFPLYHILQPLYGHRAARAGCLLLIFCSRLIRDSAAPLLDSGKMFLLMGCICLAIKAFRQRPSLTGALTLGAAAAGLALVRGEGLALALLALGAFAAAEVYQRLRIPPRKPFLSIPPWHSSAAAALFGLLILPWAMYMHSETGYPVLDRRQLDVIRRLPLLPESGQSLELPPVVASPLKPETRNQTAAVNFFSLQLSGCRIHAATVLSSHATQTVYTKLLPELYKGVHQYYIPLYLLGIGLLIKHRQWRRRDWLLAGIFIAHTLIVLLAVGRLWTQARYILPATPLLFGWAAIGGLALLDWGRQKMPREKRKIIPAALAVLALIMVFNGNHRAYQYLRKSRPGGEYAPALEAAEWLRRQGEENMLLERPPIKSTPRHYHAHRRPVLLTANRRIVFLGETDAVFPDLYTSSLSADKVLELSRDKTVDYVIIDRQWRRNYEINIEELTELPNFKQLKNFGNDSPYAVDVLLVQPTELNSD